MKKILVLFVILFILCAALIGTGLFVYSRLAPNPDTTFTLVKDSGNVSYKANSNSDYTQLNNDEIDLQNGSFVKTDAGSAAQIIMPDNSVVSLDEKTEIQVNVTKGNVSIQELAGRTWNRVQTVTQGGSYTVQTPTTIAAVRGTIFGVDYTPDTDGGSTSSVYVQEDSVQVNKKDSTAPEDSDLVQPGDQLDAVNSNTKTTLRRGVISDTFKNSNWFKRNLEIDNYYKELRNLKLLRADFKARFKQRLIENHPLLDSFINKVSTSTTNLGTLSQMFNFDSATACSGVTSQDFQTSINELKSSPYINQAQVSNLVNLLDYYQQACSDGKLDVGEIQHLQQLGQSLNQTTTP